APSSGSHGIDDGLSITELISLERDPSPDAAGQTQGAWTWYDYANKPGVEIAGDSKVTCVAQVLPDGTTHYTRYNYNFTLPPLPQLVSETDESVTLASGTLGVFTNIFSYAANAIDVTNISNSIGQVTSFAFN